jgi:hypothetical protein
MAHVDTTEPNRLRCIDAPFDGNHMDERAHRAVARWLPHRRFSSPDLQRSVIETLLVFRATDSRTIGFGRLR